MWWIEPYDFLISVSSCVFNRCFEFHTAVKPSAFQSWFVMWFSLAQFNFIAWQIRNTFIGHRWAVVWWKVDGLTQNGSREVCYLAFYKEKICPSLRWKTSEKSVSIKFVSMVIQSVSDLNRTISFLILSIFGLCVWCLLLNKSNSFNFKQ